MLDNFLTVKNTQKSVQKARGRALRVLSSFRKQEISHLSSEGDGDYYSPVMKLMADLRAEVKLWTSRNAILDWLEEHLEEDVIGMRMYKATSEGGGYGDTDHSDAFSVELMTAVLDMDEEAYYEMKEELYED